MEKLKAPHFNGFRNNEFLQFSTDAHTMVADANQQGEGLQLDAALGAFNSAIDVMNGVYKTELGSQLTQDIAQQDERRDKALIGMSLLFQGYKNHFDEAMGSAAELLLDSMNSYGDKIYYKNYQGETADIEDLVSKWENDADLQAAVTTLGLTPWLNELKAANGEFSTLYRARASEAAADPEVSMTEARMDALKAYRKLADHIDAYAVINPDGAYDELIANLNDLITSYNETVDKR
ncbi:MAG: hypothetical protein K9I47_12105 [Bacteroidales bacterium]|nr:hypothetical protein [Bacteroidales bacterium]